MRVTADSLRWLMGLPFLNSASFSISEEEEAEMDELRDVLRVKAGRPATLHSTWWNKTPYFHYLQEDLCHP